jgi:hypothetical protein
MVARHRIELWTQGFSVRCRQDNRIAQNKIQQSNQLVSVLVFFWVVPENTRLLVASVP